MYENSNGTKDLSSVRSRPGRDLVALSLIPLRQSVRFYTEMQRLAVDTVARLWSPSSGTKESSTGQRTGTVTPRSVPAPPNDRRSGAESSNGDRPATAKRSGGKPAAKRPAAAKRTAAAKSSAPVKRATTVKKTAAAQRPTGKKTTATQRPVATKQTGSASARPATAKSPTKATAAKPRAGKATTTKNAASASARKGRQSSRNG